MKLEELIRLFEERLTQHDENRREIQKKVEEGESEIKNIVKSLEKDVDDEYSKSCDLINEQVNSLIFKLNNREEGGGDNIEDLIRQAHEIISKKLICNVTKEELEHAIEAGPAHFNEKVHECFFGYEVGVPLLKKVDIGKENDVENIINKLRYRLDEIVKCIESKRDEVTEVYTQKRNQAKEICDRINIKLETIYNQEDARIQKALHTISNSIDEHAVEEAKLVGLIDQKYSLKDAHKDYYFRITKKISLKFIDLDVTREASLKFIDFEERKPLNIKPLFTDTGKLQVSFSFFSDDEINVLKAINDLAFKVTMRIWDKDIGEVNAKNVTKEYNIENRQICFDYSLYSSTIYCIEMRIEHSNDGLFTKWGDNIEFITPEFKDLCVWKECPDYVDEYKKYSIDENNPRIATRFINNKYSTIIGNTIIPLNKEISWNIKILNSWDNGDGIYIGAAPLDINQSGDENFKKCGWYFNCYTSALYSGLPHNYIGKEYGPQKGHYVHTGDSVGVVMDTIKGELSFFLNGINLGVAYEGVPLDKPLVPCVLLYDSGNSIRLDYFDGKENVDNNISVPFNITVESTTWNSITLTWDVIEGASFYQIEVDESKFLGASTTNKFAKRGFIPETEHSFRVRVIIDNKVSEWSDVVKGRTINEMFETSGWKECPDRVDENRRYLIADYNPRIAFNNNSHCFCVIIGDTPIPLNRMASWNIKILESEKNDGKNIFVGVAPFDIDQNEGYDRYDNPGWYFDCYGSTVCSGPPQYYSGKQYGPWKGKGKYVHTGDIVGVVMDTTKGELSFAINGENLGIAFKGIPLGKPLVPCVICGKKYVVELVI